MKRKLPRVILDVEEREVKRGAKKEPALPVRTHERNDLLDLRGKIKFYDGYDYKAMRG